MELHSLIASVLTTHLLLFFGGAIMLLLLAGLLRRQRNPAVSAAWLIFIISIPYAAVPLYLMFGHRKLHVLPHQIKYMKSKASSKKLDNETGVEHLLSQLNIPPAMPADRIRFHHNANEAKYALLQLIDKATTTLDISIFILAYDKTGQEVLHKLTQKALEGVRIRLLLDSVGSLLLMKHHLRPLRNAGAKIIWFMPVFHIPFRGQANLRNHRKLAIADENKIWTGGRNIADDYLLPEAQTKWIDLSFSIEGAAVLDYVSLFQADWALGQRKVPRIPEYDSMMMSSSQDQHLSQLLPSGPDNHEDILHDAIARLFMEAQDKIILVTPYFVPSETLYSLLSIAARSGIQVDIILPAKSNHRLADFARQRFLRQLHESGVRIYLLPDFMLHAKAIIVDERYALAGSANFDLRSLYLNFEHMTLFYSRTDILELTCWVENIQSQSNLWNPQPPGAVREIIEGLILLTAFQL